MIHPLNSVAETFRQLMFIHGITRTSGDVASTAVPASANQGRNTAQATCFPRDRHLDALEMDCKPTGGPAVVLGRLSDIHMLEFDDRAWYSSKVRMLGLR
jgi:hypothetical protein